MEVQVAITMKESLGQNHARNRLSAKSYRCSILEVGEPVILLKMGSPPGESLKLSQLCGPGSAICDAGWPTPDCPWSMLVCRSQKKYFRNFNFNFNYRELLSKSATFSLRGFGVVLVHKLASSYIRYDYKLLRCWCCCCCCLDQNHPHLHRQRQPKKKA